MHKKGHGLNYVSEPPKIRAAQGMQSWGSN